MKETLRYLFQQKFNCDEYRRVVLQNLLHAQQLLREPQFLEETKEGDRIYGLGYLHDTDGKEIGLYYTDVVNGDVRRKRVGFRQMMKPYVEYGADAAIAVFADKEHWRLSYMCDLKGGETSAKRFSYVFGDPKGQYNTPVNRLADLRGRKIVLDDLKETFSVEALSKEFFDGYHRHYDRILKTIIEIFNKDPQMNKYFVPFFADYIKKMMGRIVFLHFLQKKGWMNGDGEFLKNLFFNQPAARRSDFLEQVLEPLFFGIFNTEPINRGKLFREKEWDLQLLEQWKELPYLNGGLFENDLMDDVSFKLPGSLFEDLFTFMASYNFTVDENDPDDAEIGVDPEMLGKIFESLLEDNKAKGAFYTPKEIVRYMCKESLIAYLSTKTAESGKNLQDSQDFASETSRSIRRFVETHEFPVELEPQREIIDQALREVKICDPAIGSGAFPMGLLNELWRCREAMCDAQNQQDLHDFASAASRSKLKKEIIENNIYGVDIEKGAIDIARLRFWLSIVVDAEKPEPLPNFDYKFMQGNSLIESYKGFDLSRIANRLRGGQSKSTQLILGLDSDLSKRNLQLLMRDYFSVTDHNQKASMRQAINDEVKRLIVDSIGATASDLERLNPSANQDFFLWHTWFKDIFDKGGFDIVIGNPPYIRRTELPDKAKYIYEQEYRSAILQYDIYLLFIEFGLRISNKGGQLCFINPIRFFSSDYGQSCRSLIIKNYYLKRIVDVSQIEVFKNAMTYPCVLHIENKYKKDYSIEFYTPESLQVINQISEDQGKYLFTSNIIKDPECRIIVSENHELVNKIDIHSTTIDKWFKVARGLPNNKVNYDGDKYFALKSTMVKKYKIIGEYKHIDTDFADTFKGEMLIMPRTVLFLQATLKEKGIVVLDRIYYLTPKSSVNINFILGVVNSRLTNFWFEHYYGTTKVSGGYFDLNGSQIKSIPIPNVTSTQQTLIADKVQTIIEIKKSTPNFDTSSLEREIDQQVYALYNLSPEEIAIIEQ